MKFEIIENPDKNHVKKIREKLKERNGHCPCTLFDDESNLCPCQEFRDKTDEGYCHCKLFIKVKSNE